MAMMQDLISRLKGGEAVDPMAPPKNTGVSGGMPVLGGAPEPTGIPAMAPAAPAAAARTSTTTLMEGDPTKLADAAHIAKSPKYQFLSLASQYGRGQEGELLKRLQTEHPDMWNGVTFDGRGNFNVGNDNEAWKGVKHVDAYGGYNDGGDLRARWGADDPNAPQGGGMNAGRPSFAGSTIAPLLQADAQGGIQSALGKFGSASDSGFLQKLIAQLQGGA